MNYRKPSRVVSLLVFFSLLAQLCAATLAAYAGRSEPGAGGAKVEAGVFSAGVIFGDLCARADHAPAAVERPSQE